MFFFLLIASARNALKKKVYSRIFSTLLWFSSTDQEMRFLQYLLVAAVCLFLFVACASRRLPSSSEILSPDVAFQKTENVVNKDRNGSAAVSGSEEKHGVFVGRTLDSAKCTPLISRHHIGVPSLDPVRLLRVHVAFSSRAARFVANLLESIAASLPHARPEGGALVFHGVCVGLISGDEGSAVPAGEMAEFGSAAYYAALRAKHAAFTAIIEKAQEVAEAGAPLLAEEEEPQGSHTEDSDDTHRRRRVRVALLSWALFLDADTQVFPGWVEYISSLLRNSSVLAHCDANYGRSCDRITDRDAEISVFFQRESRKLINTGVALVRLSSPAALCLYRSALASFRPVQYGDQTALQRVLSAVAQQGGWCNTTTRGARLHHYVFHKLRVNAAVLSPALLVIHHAHMSGKFKAQHLLRTAARMNASTAGTFLVSPPEGSTPAWSSACPKSAASAAPCQVARRVVIQQCPLCSQPPSSSSSPWLPLLLREYHAEEAGDVHFVVNGSVEPGTLHGSPSLIRAGTQTVGYVWTVVPALIVLATLFFYHYYLAR